MTSNAPLRPYQAQAIAALSGGPQPHTLIVTVPGKVPRMRFTAVTPAMIAEKERRGKRSILGRFSRALDKDAYITTLERGADGLYEITNPHAFHGPWETHRFALRTIRALVAAGELRVLAMDEDGRPLTLETPPWQY